MYKLILALAVVALALPAHAQRGERTASTRANRAGMNIRRSAALDADTGSVPAARISSVTITNVETGEATETTISTLVDINKCVHAGRTIPQNIFNAYANSGDINGSANGYSAIPAKPGDKIPLNGIININALREQHRIMGDLYVNIGPGFGGDWHPTAINSNIFGSKSSIVNGCDVGFIKGENGPCELSGGTTLAINPDNLHEYYIYINPSAAQLLGHSGLIRSSGAVGIGFVSGPESFGNECIGKNIVHNQRTIAIDLGDVFEEAGRLYDSQNSGSEEDRKGIKDTCGKINVSALEKVKNMLLASTIVSGVGAAGGVAAAVSNGLNKDGNNSTAKTVGMVGSITSAAAGTGTAIMTGISIGDVEKAIKQIEECKKAVSQI